MKRLVLPLTATLVIATLVALAWYRSRDEAAPRYVTLTADIMTSPISITAPEPVAAEAAAVVFDVFRNVDARMSEWKATSPLSAVNEAAGRDPVEVPDELRHVIRRGVEIGELTDGAFDITWGALWGLWDFTAEHPSAPDPDEIRRRIALIDHRRIEIDDEAGTAYLPVEGMVIGLGGIAKGYALDRAAAALHDRGIDDFLISAAGQVLMSGRKSGRSWRVGVRDPWGEADAYFARIELTDVSVSTSGDYERFFVIDGERYHHILDPRTGMPAQGLRSATVVSADATLADALSTALMILGTERALGLIERLTDVEALLVDDTGQVHMTSGLAEHVQVLHPPRTVGR